MTDRELLEKAAKAARFDFNGQWYDAQTGLLVWTPQTNYESRDWSPLTDDGDALRLAVKLNLTIMLGSPNAVSPNVQVSSEDGGDECVAFAMEALGKDRDADVRRAIVRAAAAMAA